MTVSYGSGRFVVGQQDVICEPRSVTRRYMIVMGHGYTGTAISGYGPVLAPGAFTLVNRLTAGGAVVIKHDFHGDHWGNDNSVSDTEAIRLAAATYGCDTAKVVLFGGSMDGLRMWSYIRDHGDKAAGAAMIAPLTGLNAYYANPDSTLGNPDISAATQQASIGTAWGVTYPTALPSKADPIANAATIAAFHVPVSIYYADSATSGLGDADDDGNVVIKTADLSTMVAALGIDATLTNVSHTAPHGDQETVAALNYGLVDWLLARAS